MIAVLRRPACCLAIVLAGLTCSPLAALADEDTGARYTYLGAGYEWGDSKCAFEPTGSSLNGYTVEGSVGIFDFLHLIGAYYDGETTGAPEGFSSDADGQCYEIGAGLSYALSPVADIVLRGYWVNAEVDVDGASVDADGFEPELLVRFAIADKAEIHVGMAYYDMDVDGDGEDLDNSEMRIGFVYNIRPWLAVRAGGTVFDDDSNLSAGIRAYFGDNLF